jgi:hypothetical protein
MTREQFIYNMKRLPDEYRRLLEEQLRWDDGDYEDLQRDVFNFVKHKSQLRLDLSWQTLWLMLIDHCFEKLNIPARIRHGHKTNSEFEVTGSNLRADLQKQVEASLRGQEFKWDENLKESFKKKSFKWLTIERTK